MTGQKFKQQAREQQIIDAEKQRVQKDELKEGLQHAMEEKQSKRVIKSRFLVLFMLQVEAKDLKRKQGEIMKEKSAQVQQSEKEQLQTRKDQLKSHWNGLQSQLEIRKQEQTQTKQRSREHYDTSLADLREHSPYFEEDSKKNRQLQKSEMQSILLKQMSEKSQARQQELELRRSRSSTGFDIDQGYQNPYIDKSQPLSFHLKKQISDKELRKNKEKEVSGCGILVII